MVIPVRLTQVDAKMLKKHAKREDKTVSTLIRELLGASEPPGRWPA